MFTSQQILVKFSLYQLEQKRLRLNEEFEHPDIKAKLSINKEKRNKIYFSTIIKIAIRISTNGN
jgi:hypothetical protein